ncbi:hypothetical protein WKK05_09905 [Nostoc sp. UHCC 0302]|uniref:hypothetical protein n=1 Tax=Nostoc sp. UHCC 0302 TaxID=3134896 RepID=UPI00311CC698
MSSTSAEPRKKASQIAQDLKNQQRTKQNSARRTNFRQRFSRPFLPVIQTLCKGPFWTNPADPHIYTAAKTLINGQTRPFFIVQNPSYTLILEENVWRKLSMAQLSTAYLQNKQMMNQLSGSSKFLMNGSEPNAILESGSNH